MLLPRTQPSPLYFSNQRAHRFINPLEVQTLNLQEQLQKVRVMEEQVERLETNINLQQRER